MISSADDSYLLAQWHSARNADAFEALCHRHCGLVAGACRRQGSPDIAEAVQAVFLVLARRAGAVSGASLAGWLIATARLVVKDQHRTAARRRRHEQEAAMELTRQRAESSQESSWEDVREHLDAALDSLSKGRREAVLRFYLEGKSQAQVAMELNCSVPAVKMRVHEGLEHLRHFLKKRGVTLGALSLAGGLASEASAAEPALIAACTQSVLDPTPGAAALAKGITATMPIKTLLIFSSLLLVTAALAFAQSVESMPQPRPSTTTSPPMTGAGSTPPGLLARYDFAGNAKDSTGKNDDFNLASTEFIDNALHLFDGVPEGGKIAGSKSYEAWCAISGLDYQRFTIALRIKPEAFWFHNRNLITGGMSRWFDINYEGGSLRVTLNNHTFQGEAEDAALPIGAWSVLACSVDIPGHAIRVMINAGEPETIRLPSDFSLDILKHPAVEDRIFTFIDHSCAANFHGYVDEFLVYGRALDAVEMKSIPLHP